MPYFYQNLGEAEMVVTLFQYMRLLGYPAHRISILTTYNGQKALLQDVIEQRCARHPAFGRPAKARAAPPRECWLSGFRTHGVWCACLATVQEGSPGCPAGPCPEPFRFLTGPSLPAIHLP